MTAQLQERLGYRFHDPGLLTEALTHRSAGGPDNERLEFLGDALINFVIAAELYQRQPDEPEGVLSRMRASLVNRSCLAELARELDLGAHLHLGGGELKSGGQRRDSILADALEAVIGAIYVEAGFEATRAVIARLYGERLTALPAAGDLKDPKTRLQEQLQSARRPLPSYQVLGITGKAHCQTFRVECRVHGLADTTTGEGKSRRQAEQRAAEAMLERLKAGG